MEGREGFEAAVAIYRMVHESLRREIEGLDEDALNWRPRAETNSIAILVTHIVGSEREVLELGSGHESSRDRPAEFLVTVGSAGDLLRLLDRADEFLESTTRTASEEALLTRRERGGRVETVLRWMVWNASHAREHLGQVSLIRQLYMTGATPTSDGGRVIYLPG
jgi:uncharacterized damage-inducible protein DinB